MSSPSRRKAVHDLLSEKISQKRKRRQEVARKEINNPPVPPTVDNYKQNKPMVARSLNIQQVVDKPRSISKQEGMPAVNGKSGQEIVEKAVRKTRKEKSVDYSSVVIPGQNLKQKKDERA